ncbi:MAG: sugar ABC transporter permease [Candidatus Schekmanbacteria bacterium]|nr:sugar ABC transporter permease [Candidatus Schekmanbacteria bacterium]
MNRGSIRQNILAHVGLTLTTAATLYPVLWVAKIAFGSTEDFSGGLLPTHLNLGNFRHVLAELPFATWLYNSAIISAATTFLSVFLATTAAYAFSRFRFPGRQAGMMAFLVTQMFPGVLTMIPIYIIMDTLGLLNRLLGLVLVYSTTAIPFCVWMLKGYFDTIPIELEESARIDGASRFMIFRRIMLPLAMPAVAVTALFCFMTAWNEFILAATFMNQESSYTLPVGLQMMVGQFSSEWGNFAAGALLVSFPVVALFFALQKYLVSGLTAGAVKG